MTFLTFQRVFWFLMALSLVSIFAVPADTTSRFGPHFSAFFIPIASPTRRLAAWAYGRAGGEGPSLDQRDEQTIKAENLALRQEVSNLTASLEFLKQENAQWKSLGNFRKLCTPLNVIGSDSGVRDTLSLRCTSADGLEPNMPVLCVGGIAGRVDTVGVGSARVRLITDSGMREQGSFVRYETSPDGTVSAKAVPLDPMVEGLGSGKEQMVIRNLDKRSVVDEYHVHPGDVVTLNDTDWPTPILGFPLGVVASVTTQRGNPLMAEVIVTPEKGLTRLTEVMVMTHE